jgi:hypothetical protein
LSCSGIQDAILTQWERSRGVSQGETFTGIHGAEERLFREHIRGFEIGCNARGEYQRLGEGDPTGFKLKHDRIVVRDIEHVPVFQLVEEEHDAMPGQFERKKAGFVAIWDQARLECEFAQEAPGAFHPELHRKARRIVVRSLNMDEPACKPERCGNGHILCSKGVRLSEVK